MDGLKLARTAANPGKQVPASKFPEPADVYICDRCGRDITAHLHPPQSHSARPFGPLRYTCVCGERYLSGAVEWDNLDKWEKRRRLVDMGLVIILLVLLALFVASLYYGVVHRSVVLLGILGVATLFLCPLFPLFLLILRLPFEILASLWRTRISEASRLH